MAAPYCVDPRVWRVAPVAVLGSLMAQLDSKVVNVSLSAIRQDLGASIDTVQWVVSGYLLALALALPLNGWLVDRLGAKRLYLACFAGFTLASLLCGAATTAGGLVAARVLQGIMGGLLAPMAQLMVARVAGPHLARAMGYVAMPILIAPILGPSLAGAILGHAGWPWLFYVNLPVGIVAIALATILLPGDGATEKRRPFDGIGFLLISPGLVALLYGLDRVGQAAGLVSLAMGGVLVATFIAHAVRHQGTALVEVDLFRDPVFRAASATQFFNNGVLYAGQMLVPLYLLDGCGLPADEAGWLLAAMGVGMLCAYPSMGSLTDRFGCRLVSAGGALASIVGTLPFLWMATSGPSVLLIVPCLFLRGAGQGATGVPSVSAAYAAVPRDRLAQATTATNIVQRLGGPACTTLVAIVAAGATARTAVPGSLLFLFPFAALVGLQVVLLIVACRLPVEIRGGRSPF